MFSVLLLLIYQWTHHSAPHLKTVSVYAVGEERELNPLPMTTVYSVCLRGEKQHTSFIKCPHILHQWHMTTINMWSITWAILLYFLFICVFNNTDLTTQPGKVFWTSQAEWVFADHPKWYYGQWHTVLIKPPCPCLWEHTKVNFSPWACSGWRFPSIESMVFQPMLLLCLNGSQFSFTAQAPVVAHKSNLPQTQKRQERPQ